MIVTYKNHLPHAVVVGYISPAPHKTGAGICPPPDTSAQPRERFFYVRSIATPFRFMVGRAGQPQGWPDSSVSGRANPVRLATPNSFRFTLSQNTHSHLNSALLWGYIAYAVAMLAAGFDSPNHKADDRCFCMRFFYIRNKPSYAQIMVGRGRGAIVRAGFFVAGLSTLLRLTTSFDSGLVRFNKTHKEAIFLCPTANHAALTRTVSTRKPKSIVASIEPTRWHLSCHSTCCASHTAQCRYGCHQSWTTSLTISVRFRRCLTGRRTPRDFPENLTQKQHSASACWWGVRLSDIQEAL
ncbi:ash family protein [Salmonella enterica subsp. enterica serovar Newport]